MVWCDVQSQRTCDGVYAELNTWLHSPSLVLLPFCVPPRSVCLSHTVNNSNEHCQITPFKGTCWNVLNGAFFFSSCEIKALETQWRYPQLTPQHGCFDQLKKDQQTAHGWSPKWKKEVIIISLIIFVTVALLSSSILSHTRDNQHNHYCHNHLHRPRHCQLCHGCLLSPCCWPFPEPDLPSLHVCGFVQVFTHFSIENDSEIQLIWSITRI